MYWSLDLHLSSHEPLFLPSDHELIKLEQHRANYAPRCSWKFCSPRNIFIMKKKENFTII